MPSEVVAQKDSVEGSLRSADRKWPPRCLYQCPPCPTSNCWFKSVPLQSNGRRGERGPRADWPSHEAFVKGGRRLVTTDTAAAGRQAASHSLFVPTETLCRRYIFLEQHLRCIPIRNGYFDVVPTELYMVSLLTKEKFAVERHQLPSFAHQQQQQRGEFRCSPFFWGGWRGRMLSGIREGLPPMAAFQGVHRLRSGLRRVFGATGSELGRDPP